jgi:hypothetical protein
MEDPNVKQTQYDVHNLVVNRTPEQEKEYLKLRGGGTEQEIVAAFKKVFLTQEMNDLIILLHAKAFDQALMAELHPEKPKTPKTPKAGKNEEDEDAVSQVPALIAKVAKAFDAVIVQMEKEREAEIPNNSFELVKLMRKDEAQKLDAYLEGKKQPHKGKDNQKAA